MPDIHLSVIVPAYNEAARIADTVERLTAYLGLRETALRQTQGGGHAWELIVVNDGSQDDTAKIVYRLCASNPHLRLIDAPHGGKGAAVKLGMMEAKGKWRFLCDADLSMSPDQLERFFQGPEGRPRFDVSVGSREASGARRFNEPRTRHLIGRAFNWAVQIFAVRGIRDTQCGFKLFSAPAAEAVFPKQRLDGFAFDVEILFLAKKAGFTIGEVPIDWEHHGDSKVSLRKGAEAFVDIVRVRLNHLLGRYPGR